jgi:hypothetical protein
MADPGVAVMAKKKAGKPSGSPSAERVAVVVLKGTPEYRDWLNEISKESLIPVASIVRDALSKWAKERGYPKSPQR